MNAILWSGPSLIDGSPIVAIAIGSSTNAKTGNMVQTYILRADMAPMAALKSGADASICGGCPHRYAYDANGVAIAGSRTCYVNVGQGPTSVWKTFASGRYANLQNNPDAIARIGAGRMVRLGTYGDPAAVPVSVWQTLLADAIGHTGYTHQWRSDRLGSPLKGLVMASCETSADVERAARKGFTGTFRVLPVGQLPAPAALCPASAEAGKVALCADCGRCNGKGGNVEIVAHGSTAKRYLPTL